jgi:hypothetical protein
MPQQLWMNEKPKEINQLWDLESFFSDEFQEFSNQNKKAMKSEGIIVVEKVDKDVFSILPDKIIPVSKEAKICFTINYRVFYSMEYLQQFKTIKDLQCDKSFVFMETGNCNPITILTGYIAETNSSDLT